MITTAVGFDLHRGVVAVARRRDHPSVAEVAATGSRFAVLEGLNDAENLGAIARAARALGIDALIVDPRSTDPYSRRSVRVSMGEILLLPIARPAAEDWRDVLGELGRAGVETWAMSPMPSAESIWDVEVPERLAVVLGAEGPGLDRRTIERATRTVRIPLRAGVDSLNVGHAAAVTFAAIGRPHPELAMSERTANVGPFAHRSGTRNGPRREPGAMSWLSIVESVVGVVARLVAGSGWLTETELREQFRLAIFEVVLGDVSGRELLVQQPELLEEFVLAGRAVVCIVFGAVGTLAVTDRKLFSLALLLAEFALTLLIRLGTSGQAESPPSDDLDVDGLGALASSGDLEFDGVTVVQRAATGADDVGVVNEDVVAVVTRDETEALLVIEELHCTCGHFGSLFNTGATIDSRLQ